MSLGIIETALSGKRMLANKKSRAQIGEITHFDVIVSGQEMETQYIVQTEQREGPGCEEDCEAA